MNILGWFNAVLGKHVQVSNTYPWPIQIISKSIQTHNAVVVAGSNNNANTNWISCDGYRNLSTTMQNSAATTNSIDVLWSNDGINQHSSDTLASSSASQERSGTIAIRAPYFKIKLYNGDATNKTMSSWTYLS